MLVLISVVIPARNEAGNIGFCVNSVKCQSLKPFEILVVDNASTDKTGEIARFWGAKVINCFKVGRGAARNEGVNQAEGELIAFIDADCQAAPNWLEELVKELSYLSFYYDGVAGNVYAFNRTRKVAKIIELLTKDKPHYATWNILYRKKAIIEAGGFNEDLLSSEDTDLAHRILKKGCIGYTPKAVVYHQHPTLIKFLKQQHRFGYWDTHSRIINGRSLLQRKISVLTSPLTIIKHLHWLPQNRLMPFILYAASLSHAAGTLQRLIGLKY